MGASTSVGMACARSWVTTAVGEVMTVLGIGLARVQAGSWRCGYSWHTEQVAAKMASNLGADLVRDQACGWRRKHDWSKELGGSRGNFVPSISLARVQVGGWVLSAGGGILSLG
ncbi:hypothetical protein Nepgr_000567 [Nepenthes gracilis]|uniref:Uncharacterized protein n=1 Tax=Nepenthes gracilis TaxID=150966 RepID=A0AAD3RWY8_NEPGR|nr:hypothetical protein Nepgr_000567 [Nepenthes gracilis]